MEECGHGHHPIPLLEGRMEGSHALCTSDLEQWRGVAMPTPTCLPEGRREAGDGLCSSLSEGVEEFLGSGGVFPKHLMGTGKPFVGLGKVWL